MGVLSERYWRERFDRANPCWSGERWVDLEHGFVMRRAIRRAWPRGRRGVRLIERVLDVGCGSGRWSDWMAEEFACEVIGTDAVVNPGVADRIPFFPSDAEQLGAALRKYSRRWHPDLVVFMNSLAYMADWRQAVAQACKLSDRVLCFDNFMTPTPPWLVQLEHRRHVELPELLTEFSRRGFQATRVVAGDWWHRKLFLKTPRWSWPVVAWVTLLLDWVTAAVIRPEQARHVAVLFTCRHAR
jgi:SAM-dependent methyltransferase